MGQPCEQGWTRVLWALKRAPDPNHSYSCRSFLAFVRFSTPCSKYECLCLSFAHGRLSNCIYVIYSWLHFLEYSFRATLYSWQSLLYCRTKTWLQNARDLNLRTFNRESTTSFARVSLSKNVHMQGRHVSLIIRCIIWRRALIFAENGFPYCKKGRLLILWRFKSTFNLFWISFLNLRQNWVLSFAI